MIRTGEQYRDSIRDGREVYINGERVRDVTRHPMFKPLVDIRARIYDMQHDPATRDVMTSRIDGEDYAVGLKLPYTQQDWWEKRRATDAIFHDIGGVVTRVGDETVGEMWSLFDGQDVLNEVDPQFSKNISQPHRQGDQARSLPCLGQHRSQGRPLEASAGPGPRHAAACREGDRRGHHRARRQVRDRRRLCQPGLHQAHHRQLGRREAVGIRGGLHLRSARRRT